jgi:hypothetical protein
MAKIEKRDRKGTNSKERSEREELLRNLKEQAARQAAQNEEYRKKAEKEQLALKEWQIREQTLYPEKLDLSRELFKACQTFLDDGVVVEQLQAVSNTNLSTDRRGIEIMLDGWGHKPGHETCWSRLYLKSLSGMPVLVYWAGFKWMPNFPERDLTTPEQFAQLLSNEYISKIMKDVRGIGIYGMVGRRK